MRPAPSPVLTYKYRIKDRSARKGLRQQAVACNQIWNYCVALQRDIERRYRAGARPRRWPTTFDLHKLTSGTSKELGIHANSINEVCRFFVQSRDAHRRAPRFRASFGPRRALGWIPFKPRDRRIEGNAVTYLGKRYRFFGQKCRPLPEVVKGGYFVEDARGRWYVCFIVEATATPPCGESKVGIDLGLKSLATLSDGRAIEAPQHYRALEGKLAVAQRAGNKQRARHLHAKITNCRKDFLHKLSTELVRKHGVIAVGNVSSVQLAKTRMAKSVLDAGWSMLRAQLRYKCQQAGAVYLDIDERFTTQACSCCGIIPDSSPKGMGALGVRRWDCSECGASHDRDVNAARNILNAALSAQRLVGESRRSPDRHEPPPPSESPMDGRVVPR